MKKLIFLVLCMLPVIFGYAQKGKAVRVEMEIEDINNDYFLIPVGESGLILFYEKEDDGKEATKWVFTKLDDKFKEIWEKELSLDDDLVFEGYRANEQSNELNLLFCYKMGGNLQVKEEYGMVVIDYKGGIIELKNAISPVTFNVKDFEVIGNNAFIGGQTRYNFWETCATMYCLGWIGLFTGSPVIPLKATMVKLDIDKESTEIIPYNVKGQSKIIGIFPSFDKKYVYSVLQVYYKKKFFTYLDKYDVNGEQVSSFELEPSEANVAIISAKVSDVSKNKTIILGTCEKYTKKPYGTSNGMYFSIYEGDKQEVFERHNFTDFDNFFKYLPAKTESKMEKKKAKAEKKGKELLVNYNMLTHDVIEKDGAYIMIGEAYYAHYHTECTTTYVNGAPQTTCRQVFDGWMFTHAVIAAFDENGKKLWDNCFEIQNILTYDLSEKIKVMFKDDEIVLVYSIGGYINSKVIKENKIVEGKHKTKIDTNYKDDKVKENGGSSIAYWYDNYFIAYGYQRIKNTGKKDTKRKRTVFYFNKIEFD